MKSSKTVWIVLRKVCLFVFSMFVLSLLVFYVSRLAPGDPLTSYYGEGVERISVEERAIAEERLGLNQPIYVQYAKWVRNVFKGDFGISYKYKQDVLEVIKTRTGNTLVLGGIGFVLIFVLALVLGFVCAKFEGSLFDRIMCKVGSVISCVPEFWLSLVLILIFSVTLRVLPSSGAYSIGAVTGNSSDMAGSAFDWDMLVDRVRHLVLPLSVVVISHLWYYAYMVRNKILDEMRAEYVLLALSKGLSRNRVVLTHCLRNVMPTFFSMMAISVVHIMSGTYIVENVFSYPGMGTLAYESARYHDYNLLMIICLLSGAVVFACNMIAQAINEKMDNRLRAETEVDHA